MAESFPRTCVCIFVNCILPVVVFSLANIALLICTCTIIFSQLLANAVEKLLSLFPNPISRPGGQGVLLPRARSNISLLRSFVCDCCTVLSSFCPKLACFADRHENMALLDACCPRVLRCGVTNASEEDPTCAVCLELIKAKATVRALQCSHLFHAYVIILLDDLSVHISPIEVQRN